MSQSNKFQLILLSSDKWVIVNLNAIIRKGNYVLYMYEKPYTVHKLLRFGNTVDYIFEDGTAFNRKCCAKIVYSNFLKYVPSLNYTVNKLNLMIQDRSIQKYVAGVPKKYAAKNFATYHSGVKFGLSEKEKEFNSRINEDALWDTMYELLMDMFPQLSDGEKRVKKFIAHQKSIITNTFFTTNHIHKPFDVKLRWKQIKIV